MKKDLKTAGLARVLFGGIRGGVLGLLYGAPDRSFYTREIARSLAVSPGAIAHELAILRRAELIRSHRLGNHVFYHANRDSAVFADLKALLAKTVGLAPLLKRALEPIESRIRVAFIYGSVAKEEESAESDVDLMVIGSVQVDHVFESLSRIEKQTGRQVNPTVYSTNEFGAKVRSGNHFLTSVVRGPKIFLIGDEDELGRLGGVEAARDRAHQR